MTIKIGYLFNNCPHYLEHLPADVEAVMFCSDGQGGYRREDLAQLATAGALIVAGAEPVHDSLLAACPRVKIVQKTGVGYESFDLEAARRRGVPCCNLPGVNKVAVAEHALLLMLAELTDQPGFVSAMVPGRPLDTEASKPPSVLRLIASGEVP